MMIKVVVELDQDTGNIQVASNVLDLICMDVLMAAWRTVLVKSIKAEIAGERRVVLDNGDLLKRLPPA